MRKKGLDHQHPSCLADGTHLSPGERCRRGPCLASHWRDGMRRDHRGLQQLTTPRELGLPDAVGQEPVVPDVLKPGVAVQSVQTVPVSSSFKINILEGVL